MKGNVLITGGTGLVGKRLTQMLLEAGYAVAFLSRSNRRYHNVKVYNWDVKEGQIEEMALQEADYIVHLAGASVAGSRWTPAYKKEILESRTLSTDLLFEALKKLGKKPKAFVAASAIGFYGDTKGQAATEEAAAGDDFLAEVCVKWEAASQQMSSMGIRTAIVRVGVVLSDKGGALPQMAMPVKFFVGAPLGSGDQSVSWIHLDDLCKIFLFAIENQKIEGVFNGVAPNPASNESLTKEIAHVLGRPVWPLAVPGFVLKVAIGEMSETVLANIEVSSQKIEETGFQFTFPTLQPALKDLL